MWPFGKSKKRHELEQMINENRALFYTKCQKYFDLGLLREIYSSDLVSICNLTNSFYLVVHFGFYVENTFFGVVAESRMAKNVVEDNSVAMDILEYYVDKEQKEYVMTIDDTLIKYFMPIKEAREKEGSVSPNIDLEFEAEMMKRKN